MRLADIETPAVLIDRVKLEANLRGMQELAQQHGLVLRPHAKTHKSVEIGRRQIALGACGLTVATVDEALVFGSNGIDSITISRPAATTISTCPPSPQRRSDPTVHPMSKFPVVPMSYLSSLLSG